MKLKPIATCLHAFSCAWLQLHVLASSSDWFIGLFTTVVIGQSNYFGYGFTTLIMKIALKGITILTQYMLHWPIKRHGKIKFCVY